MIKNQAKKGRQPVAKVEEEPIDDYEDESLASIFSQEDEKPQLGKRGAAAPVTQQQYLGGGAPGDSYKRQRY